MSRHSPVNLTGAVLGWHNKLYELTYNINSRSIGRKLGVVGYHGSISGSFTIFQFLDRNPDSNVVFEFNGYYYKANVVNSNVTTASTQHR